MALITGFARFVLDMFEQAPGITQGMHSWNSGFDTNAGTYSFDSDTNPGLKVWAATIALIAGTVNVNLVSLPRTLSDRTALNLTNLTIKVIRIRNNGANPMTFTNPATNGYPFFTATTGHIVGAGDDFMQATRRPAGFGTVVTADSIIQVDGTTTQTFTMGLIAETPA